MNPTPIPNFDIPYLDPELIASLSSAPIYIVLTLVIFGLLALLVWLIRKEQNEQHADMTERATSAMAITELINALRGATGDQIEVSKNFSNSTENLTRLFHEQIKAMNDNTQSIRDLETNSKARQEETSNSLLGIKGDIIDARDRFENRLNSFERMLEEVTESNRALYNEIKKLIGETK